VAILWPVIRLIPAELRDAARVDGARPRDELRFVVWPLGASACLRAGLAVAVLSLGELSAGKLVETPGSQTFAHKVFEQMHYGVTSELAALCLVLLGIVAGSATLFRLIAKR
jgi:ABC-type Fe3+ transport system permease subunit